MAPNPEYYVDHEVRIRLLENLIQDVAKDFKQLKSMLIKIGAGICVSILIPVLLHYFGAA
jgi:hypothetical protein